MTLNIVSDLHDPNDIDFSKFNYDADYIVVAGDSSKCIIQLNREIYQRSSHARIIDTFGNHDIFKDDILKTISSNLYGHNFVTSVGQHRHYEKNKVMFLCAPLLSLVDEDWISCTHIDDYKKFTEIISSKTDYLSILKFNHFWNSKFISDLNYLTDWILETRRYDTECKIIIVTHGVPAFELIENSLINDYEEKKYFATGKDIFYTIFQNVDLWVHGHSHEFCDMKIFNTRCIRNPLRNWDMKIFEHAYSYTIEI